MKFAWQTAGHFFYRAIGKIGRRWPSALMETAVSGKKACDYMLVVYPHHYGWVALLPDFRGATGRAADMEAAVLQAIEGARKVCSAMEEVGAEIPDPLDIALVKSNSVWVRVYGIDWARAVVRTVSREELMASKSRFLTVPPGAASAPTSTPTAA